MTTTTPTLVFPTPVLTPIVGRPTYATLHLLQQQLYQNARAIMTTLGGGLYGHLAVIMPPIEYNAIPNVVAFDVPDNPGEMPMAPLGADSYDRSEFRRVHLNRATAFNTYHAVRIALQNQILASVERTYLQALSHNTFGFTDVLPYVMLTHLKINYGTMTGHEVEQNRTRLGETWDTATPIETLWERIVEIRDIALTNGQPIRDAAVIANVLPMFDRTGLFLHSVNSWRDLDPVQQTYARFVEHFTRANEQRVTNLTTRDLNFAGAATVITTAVTPPRTTSTQQSTAGNTGNGWHYCWSHGLSTYSAHTGHTCRQRKPGHIESATAYDRQGGSNVFSTREDRRPRNNPNSTTPAT
jgi:hypothetical protein